MTALSQDGDVTLIARTVFRRHALRRLVTVLTLDAGFLFFLCYPGFHPFGEWSPLLVLPIGLSLPFASVNCLEIYCGFPLLLFQEKWLWIAHWRRGVLRAFAVLLVVCTAMFVIRRFGL
jgi:hypothetical protein